MPLEENNSVDEIDYSLLKIAIEDIDINGEGPIVFVYEGLIFMLYFIHELSESDNYSPVSLSATGPGQYDIYIYERLTNKEKQRGLFHEILESYLRCHGFGEEKTHTFVLDKEEKLFGPRIGI